MSTVFYVPNNEEGRAFLKQARLYLNRAHWQMRPRGRGPRRSQGYDRRSVPLAVSVYFGVYFYSPTANEIASAEWRKTYDEITRLRKAVAVGTVAQTEKKIDRLIKLFYLRKRAIDLVN